MEILLYTTKSKKTPFKEWIDELDKSVRLRVQARIAKIEDQGAFGVGRALKEGVHELKFTFGGGIRVYYGLDGTEFVILLAGGDKKRQSEDIEKAIRYWKDYLKNKEEE